MAWKKCLIIEKRNLSQLRILKILEFVLMNNCFELNRKAQQQLLDTVNGAKYAPPNACMFLMKLEAGFLESQKY